MSLSLSAEDFTAIISGAGLAKENGGHLESIDNKLVSARTAVIESVVIVPNTTSTEILAANSEINSLVIQNTTAYPFALSVSNEPLTDVVPSVSNICFVLYPGATYPPLGAPLPTGRLNAYQASGSSQPLYIATS